MTRTAPFALALALAACSPAKNGPQTGSQTNWLRACDTSAECGDLECLCGRCTATCESDAACADLTGASCLAPSDRASIALCGGLAEQSMCLPPAAPELRVSIDPDARHQTLVGFGASLAYADDAIAAHPDRAALYELVFEDAGLDALRIRNRFDAASEGALRSTREILAAAEAHLGHAPFVFMTSGSPPAALKANASRTCRGNLESCTLARLPSGAFDYAGFAAHWRDSLDAYARLGVAPDFVSIQNNPNWVPPEIAPNEACRFLPEEGSAQVRVDGVMTEVAYPGYREAIEAVRDAFAGMAVVPQLAAPEVSTVSDVSAYAYAVGAPSLGAIAVHLYSQDATAVDVASLEAARGLSEQLDRPVFQTEMQADGLETAVLAHHALTASDATLYMQNDLVALNPSQADIALVSLSDDGLETQGPYYALRHFAKHTNPGWARVDAESSAPALLSSAWLAPDGEALTVVLINPGAQALDPQVAVPEALRARLARTQVTRTVFESAERGADLGALSADGVVHVPARSIATIAFSTPSSLQD